MSSFICSKRSPQSQTPWLSILNVNPRFHYLATSFLTVFHVTSVVLFYVVYLFKCYPIEHTRASRWIWFLFFGRMYVYSYTLIGSLIHYNCTVFHPIRIHAWIQRSISQSRNALGRVLLARSTRASTIAPKRWSPSRSLTSRRQKMRSKTSSKKSQFSASVTVHMSPSIMVHI